MNKASLIFILLLSGTAAFLIFGLEIVCDYYHLSFPNHAIKSTIFLYGTTLFSFMIFYSKAKNRNSSINLLLGISVVKLLLNILFVGVIIYIDRTEAINNIAYFMTAYLSLTLLEIISMLYIKTEL